MDLSTAMSAMSPAPAPSAPGSAGSGGGAVACPVCTLYLREGISLQKHLDTHPKEQVIEALIRASSAGASSPAALLGQQQPSSAPPTPTPTPTPTATPTPSSPPQLQTQAPAPAPSSHVPPHPAHSPYPIGPIFECPPLNAMIPPPQFTSFSYQQFVNNGTMMIPAQYAMAQAQPPQASQMMQMLYSPYGMYHQQQIPTVQMISAPPPPMMPPHATSAAAQQLPPTSVSTTTAVTTRMRPAEPTSPPPTSTSTTTTGTSTPPPRSTQRESSPTATEQLIVESTKHMFIQKTVPEPDRILPDLEMPTSPEPADKGNQPEQDSVNVEHREQEQQQPQSDCPHVEQNEHPSENHLTTLSVITRLPENSNDDEKTESILPDIEDNQEIESLLVRSIGRIESHKSSEIQVVDTTEPMQTSVEDKNTERDETSVMQTDVPDRDKDSEVKANDDQEIVSETIEPEDLSGIEMRTFTHKHEVKQIDRLVINMDEEFRKVELSHKENCDNHEISLEETHEISSVEPSEKLMEEDETTSASYPKMCNEPNECKIIVVHEETDASSIISLNSVQCDLEIQKIINPSYHRKCESAPSSPVSKTKFQRPSSRASLPADFDRSNGTFCSYPVGFEATTLQDFLKDNYNDEDMELEEPEHHSYVKQTGGIVEECSRSHTPMSACVSSASILKARRSKMTSSPVSAHSDSTYGHLEEDDDSDAESCSTDRSNVKMDEEYEEEEDEDRILHNTLAQQTLEVELENKKDIKFKSELIIESSLGHQKEQHRSEPADFRSQSLITEHYQTTQFPINHHPHNHPHHSHHTNHHDVTHSLQESYTLSNSTGGTSQNLLNMSESVDPTTSTDSKSFSSSNKLATQKPSTELLNISEDAHAGPINVFEFDGLQILVPSTFISESSQKAVSGTSQQSIISSDNGAGNDEEVKSVNMRADETMPPRGELSEQESNGCTEQSAWQLYMGQESSRMSTSYDLMARESWEESEGSEHEDNNGGPLLDSRSLATHFTSSLFLDRERKTPTRLAFKCSHCPEMFECPKERRVHSTMVHKEAGPSSYSNDNSEQQPELKDIKLLESRTNVFEDMFVPSSLQHLQHAYQHHQQQQQPLLHQLQPPQSSVKVAEGEQKLDGLHHLSSVTEVICNLCNQRFSSEKSLQIHNRRMHIADPVKRIRENAKCQICNEEFISVASFNLHLKVHPLECGQCGKYFYRKQNFKLHMKRHLGIKPFPCTLCDKAFLTKQKLDEHTNGHTGNAPVKCNLCNETFRRYSNLTQHKNRHHLNIKKKLKDYICHCGEVFHTKKKLAWHKETHDEKPKACTYCNERFIHMASLTRHMRRAHNRRFVPDAQRENENVECPICKCIYLRSSLAVHMRVHNGERPYECQVCSKAFSTKWNLQLHKWTHAARSTKPFKCNQCSAAFYRHSDYTAHMNSHRNVRPYTCNYCGAQFIRKYNCLRHVKEHEENKQYTCDVCNKTFHRSYYLKEHLRVHSGQRPYTCHICGKSSSTKSNHNKHVRIHHAREPVNTEN